MMGRPQEVDPIVYDPDIDTYRCPAGQTLTYRFDTVEKERHIHYYTN